MDWFHCVSPALCQDNKALVILGTVPTKKAKYLRGMGKAVPLKLPKKFVSGAMFEVQENFENFGKTFKRIHYFGELVVSIGFYIYCSADNSYSFGVLGIWTWFVIFGISISHHRGLSYMMYLSFNMFRFVFYPKIATLDTPDVIIVNQKWISRVGQLVSSMFPVVISWQIAAFNHLTHDEMKCSAFW